GDHLHNCRECRITRCGRDCTMKCNVVNEKLLWMLERCKHGRNLFRHAGELFTSRAFGSESGSSDFENRPGFKHVLKTETVKLGEQTQRFTVERRRPIDNESACSLARLQHTHRD